MFPSKEERQQIILCLHRTRQGFVEERTASYNRLRGLISEFSIVLPQKVTGLRQSIGKHIDALPGYAKPCPSYTRGRAQQASDAAPRHWPDHCQCIARVDVKWVGLAPGEPD